MREHLLKIEQIVGLLKEQDMTIEEIAKELKRSIRHTRRFLEGLQAQERVEVYQKGRKWRWRLI